ncbi:LysM domain-containing GPI-anchored protein 1 [Glycine soja]
MRLTHSSKSIPLRFSLRTSSISLTPTWSTTFSPRRSSSKSPSPASASTTFANLSLLITRPAPPTPSSIADAVYVGLVSSNQLCEANSIFNPDVSQNLVVPLPCTCFNGSNNSFPAIYLSYVVRPVDTLAVVAARYFTTLTYLMNVNAMGSTAINDDDILVVPIPGS